MFICSYTPTNVGRVPRFLLTFLLLFTAVVHAGTNSWTPTGPAGGWVDGLAWHPARAGVLLATVGGRLYRSVDSGRRWTEVAPGANVRGGIVFDPNNPDRVLVLGFPPLRSADGGATFQPVATNPGNLLTIAADGSAVYAAGDGRVFRSVNFGDSWTEISAGLPGVPGLLATALRASPTNPAVLYVCFNGTGVFRSTDAGVSWTSLSSLPVTISGIALDPRDPSRIVVTAPPLVRRSTDGGASWSTVLVSGFRWFDFDPAVSGRLLAFESAGRQLLESLDGGALWAPVATVPAGDVFAGAFNSRAPAEFALGTNEGVLVSTDSARSLIVRSEGLDGAAPFVLATSNAAPFQIYASFFWGPAGVHVFRSGAWQPLSVPQLYSVIPPRALIQALAANPLDSSVVYAGGFGGLARSVDSGTNWSLIRSQVDGMTPADIAVDPSNPRVLSVASQTAGFLRSTDGGASWVQRNNGLPPGLPLIKVFVDPADTQRIYVLDQPNNYLYRTTDGGAFWTRVAGGLPGNEYVMSVAFDPIDPRRVYIGSVSGLYRSVDGGMNWSLATLPIGTRIVRSILLDPTMPGTLVLLTGGPSGVIRSVDGGTSWEVLPYPVAPNDSLAAGILDPGQPGTLHVGGFNSGMRVYRIVPDLAISFSGLPSGSVSPGATLTLRALVQNRLASAHAASDVLSSITLPTGWTPGAVASTRGSCTRSGQVITCRHGGMNVGDAAQVDFTLTADPTTTGSGVVAATAAAREADLVAADNSATANLIITPVADLSVALTVPATATRGAAVVGRGRVTNRGPAAAPGTRLVFTSPPGLTAVGGTGPLGSCVVAAGTVTCQAGTLGVNAEAAFDVDFTVATEGSWTVTLRSLSDVLDPEASNDVATQVISVGTSSAGGGGGGGGTLDLLVIGGLLSLIGARVRPVRRTVRLS